MAGAADRLMQAAGDSIGRRANRLSLVSARLDGLSPVATLSRGYAMPLGDDGTVLRRGSMFETGTEFDLRVVDATIRCEVRGIEEIAVPTEAE